MWGARRCRSSILSREQHAEEIAHQVFDGGVLEHQAFGEGDTEVLFKQHHQLQSHQRIEAHVEQRFAGINLIRITHAHHLGQLLLHKALQHQTALRRGRLLQHHHVGRRA